MGVTPPEAGRTKLSTGKTIRSYTKLRGDTLGTHRREITSVKLMKPLLSRNQQRQAQDEGVQQGSKNQG